MGEGARRRVFAASMLALAILFAALGVWQLERRRWKLDLIAAVSARAGAPPVPAPGPEAWPGITARDDAYRHVRATGTFLAGRTTLVQALTERGPGFWAIDPLRTGAGWTVLVNRGFVPGPGHDPLPAGPVAVTGLLRITEPGGAFLRANDPLSDRWRSRDVAAIAGARGIEAAPYFVDAEAAPGPAAYPVGGLTVIAFRNSHLVYALTWFALAAICLAGLRAVGRTAA